MLKDIVYVRGAQRSNGFQGGQGHCVLFLNKTDTLNSEFLSKYNHSTPCNVQVTPGWITSVKIKWHKMQLSSLKYQFLSNESYYQCGNKSDLLVKVQFVKCLSNRALFSVYITSSKHEECWENLRQLYKPETQSRVRITFKSSLEAPSVQMRLYKLGKSA